MASESIKYQVSSIKYWASLFAIRHSLFAKQGFTLIELLIGISITVVIVFITAAATQDAFRAIYREQERLALLDETRRTVDSTSETLAEANAVLATYSYGGQVYITSSNTLVLVLPAYDAAGVLLSGVVDTVIFSRDPAAADTFQMIVRPAAGSRRPAATRRPTNHLTQLSFRYYRPDDEDGDDEDEEITDPLALTTATRVEIALETARTLSQWSGASSITEQLAGGSRLRNAP